MPGPARFFSGSNPSRAHGRPRGVLRRLGVGLVLCLCMAIPAAAGEFAGLVPGIARKADADRILGKPVREVVRGERYDYDPLPHDAGRISIEFERATQVIRSIDLYFKTTYGKAHYQRWFGLKTPAKTERDGRGNLVEHYIPEGIVLHYQGAGDSAPVAYFSHVDMLLAARESPRPAESAPVAAPPPSPPVGGPAAYASYLGLSLRRHEGVGVKVTGVAPGSPAERAGLRAGDAILELGNAGFYEAGIEVWRVTVMMADLPPGRPLQALVQRGEERIETAITPERRALDPERRRSLTFAFQQAARGRMESGDHQGAAEMCEKAIRLEPAEPFHYATLAEVCRKRGDADAAVAALKRGIGATGSYRLYRQLGFYYRERERYDDAIGALREAAARTPADKRDAELYNQLGYSYLRAKREREALRAFEEAARIDPGSPVATYFMARCHDEMNHREEAVRAYRAFLDLGEANEERNRFVRKRLEALTGNSGN